MTTVSAAEWKEGSAACYSTSPEQPSHQQDRRVIRRAHDIIKDNTHPQNMLFPLLPSGKHHRSETKELTTVELSVHFIADPLCPLNIFYLLYLIIQFIFLTLLLLL